MRGQSVTFRCFEEGDTWARKITLESQPTTNSYKIINALCWSYVPKVGRSTCADVFKTKGGCWYGVCSDNATLWTNILQERVLGQYHIVSGVPLKAMFVASGEPTWHAWTEIYVKDKGYHVLDFRQPTKILPGRSPIVTLYMCNYYTGGVVAYKKDWAGLPPSEPPPPPEKTYIKATTTPSNASIWLKKH